MPETSENKNAVRSDSLISRVRESSLYILVSKITGPVITILITAYVIRKLSVDHYGIYNIYLAIMAYIGLVSSTGLLNVFQRFIPEFNEKRQYANLKKLVVQGSLLRMVLTVIIIAVILCISGFFSKIFKLDGNFEYFKWFALGILFFLESQLIGLTLTSIFLHKYYVIIQVVYTAVRAFLIVVMIELGWNLQGLLLSEVIAFCFLLFLQILYLYQKFWKHTSNHSNIDFPKKRIMRYGGFSYFNEVGEQILDVSTDIFIISAYLNNIQVGLYAFANEIMRLLSKWMPHRLLMDVITPAFFAKYEKSKDRKDLELMFNILIKLIAFFFFPLVVGMLVLGESFIQVIDPKYENAYVILCIVAVFSAINAFAYPLGLLVQAVEKVEIHLMSKVFSIYNLIGDLLVVKPYGIEGVAVVTGSAIAFKNIFTLIMIKRHIQFCVHWTSLLKTLFNASLMGFALLLFRSLIQGMVSFLVIAVCGAALYLGISCFLKIYSRHERDFLNKILKKQIIFF